MDTFHDISNINLQMHLRFDGYLGFPGGTIEPNETVIDGVSREVQEEVAIGQSIS